MGTPLVAPTPAVETVPVAEPIPTMVETAMPTMMSSAAVSNPMFMTGASSYPTASVGAPAGVAYSSSSAVAGYGYGGISSGATMPLIGTTQGMMPQMSGLTLPPRMM